MAQTIVAQPIESTSSRRVMSQIATADIKAHTHGNHSAGLVSDASDARVGEPNGGSGGAFVRNRPVRFVEKRESVTK